MDISNIGSIIDSTDTATNTKDTLGKEDFLNLLLKQLSYQDPLNPMDSTEFTTQLTQFTALEELNNINSTLNDVLAFQNSMQNAAVTNLIGKSVKVSGNTIYLQDAADISYELSREASSVKISIFDGTGGLVRSQEVGPQTPGDKKYLWDGRDNFGNQMSEGTYSFEVEALDISGNPVEAITSSTGNVRGIHFKDNITYLILDDGRNVYLSDIQSIEERRN